ncbi:MAG: hypothetical protein K2L27_04980 [Muribaculaceae bacterium]|nr:hypothetical protein [Muribaculaceae bacterium]
MNTPYLIIVCTDAPFDIEIEIDIISPAPHVCLRPHCPACRLCRMRLRSAVYLPDACAPIFIARGMEARGSAAATRRAVAACARERFRVACRPRGPPAAQLHPRWPCAARIHF